MCHGTLPGSRGIMIPSRIPTMAGPGTSFFRNFISQFRLGFGCGRTNKGDSESGAILKKYDLII
eukprot:2939020-Rhodomonas_salina.1